MSTSVLIVEKDLSLLQTLRAALSTRGFEVSETTDGKGAPELIRSQQPSCVVLAVDLDAGQNGYLICKKLRSDDELKRVPIIIIGDPKGFAPHQKLKTRADQYVGKPLDPEALVSAVGALVGFPEIHPAAPAEDFDPGALLEEAAAEDTPFEQTTETQLGDADLAAVDNLFSGGADAPALEELNLAATSSAAASGFDDFESDRTVVGFAAMAAPPPRPAFQSSPSTVDAPEARELRAKVTELTGTLDDARARAEELEGRVRELESQLEAKSTELETARSAGGKSDSKEVFALRDAANKKDKEILRLKNELNAKEQEVVDLRDKENALEQQASESAEGLAHRDAQLKTLQARADQLTAERKKIDQQLTQSREEGRAASAKLQTLESDFAALQATSADQQAQLDSLRTTQQETEAARQQLEGELAEARGEGEALRSQLDERTREADELRGQVELLQADLDATRTQLTTQATAFAEEISGLRQRLSDAETETLRTEEKAQRTVARLKAQQDQAERARASLQHALDVLSETPAEGEGLDADGLAEA